jgi:hypothetical protein
MWWGVHLSALDGKILGRGTAYIRGRGIAAKGDGVCIRHDKSRFFCESSHGFMNWWGGYDTMRFGVALAAHYLVYSLDLEFFLNGGEVIFFVTQVSI